MAIVVIEGGSPNGTDLVSREARLNPNSRINGGPPVETTFMRLGDEYVLAGITFEPRLAKDDDGVEHLAVVLYAVGGRESKLVGVLPAKVALGEVARVSIQSLRERFAAALAPEVEPPQ